MGPVSPVGPYTGTQILIMMFADTTAEEDWRRK